ncbi:hypothetical protein SLS57_006501 [Botryosphaeria dothidea]
MSSPPQGIVSSPVVPSPRAERLDAEASPFEPQQQQPQDEHQQNGNSTSNHPSNHPSNYQPRRQQNHYPGRHKKRAKWYPSIDYGKSSMASIDTIISREQILANARVLYPGLLLDVVTTVNQATGECFAYLISPSHVDQPYAPFVNIMKWGKGFAMHQAMTWLQHHINTTLHGQLRNLVQVPWQMHVQIWGGMGWPQTET